MQKIHYSFFLENMLLDPVQNKHHQVESLVVPLIRLIVVAVNTISKNQMMYQRISGNIARHIWSTPLMWNPGGGREHTHSNQCIDEL